MTGHVDITTLVFLNFFVIYIVLHKYTLILYAMESIKTLGSVITIVNLIMIAIYFDSFESSTQHQSPQIIIMRH